MPVTRILATAAIAAIVLAPQASGQDLLKVGNAAPTAFSFVWVKLGDQAGIYAKHGLKLEHFGFPGGGRVDSGLISGDIDIGLNSGAALAGVAKGVPARAVAVTAHEPSHLVIVVRTDTNIYKPQDLKGARIATSTAGALTDWLPHEVSKQLGWGPDGIITQPLGQSSSMLAGLKMKQVEGLVTGIAQAYDLADRGETRTVLNFGTYLPDFHANVLYASDKAIAQKPDAVRRFVLASLETIKYMKTHKAETVALAVKETNVPEKYTARSYDELMPSYSEDGRFRPKSLAVLQRSFVELKQFDSPPDMSKLYTERFLPSTVTQ
jgi:NitT/TauT family transport system substrate-binding protein